jgi:hypothetical protein
MRRYITSRWFAGALVALLPVAAAAELTVTTTPSSIILGATPTVTIDIAHVPGQGTPLADVNVGAVERIEPRGGGVRLHYTPPAQRFPQLLCLAVWRDGTIDDPVHVVRLPLLAPTMIPVQTRHHSQVTVDVGGRTFGPVSSGGTGRLSIPVVVAPGDRRARVVVVDQAGLRTAREIAIVNPAYNQIVLALYPRSSGSSTPRFRIAVDSAEPSRLPPLLQVADQSVELEPVPGGGWSVVWAPPRRPREGQVSIKASLRDQPASVRYAQITIGPAAFSVRTLHVRPETGWRSTEGLRGDLGLAIGMVHNTGDLFTFRVVVELGLDYPLPYGRIGLRLFGGFSRAAQTIPGREGLADAESTVTLLPFGGGVTYRLTPVRYVPPTFFVGALAQIVRTSNTAPYAAERLRYDVAPGVLALAGVEPRVGPGRFFLQAGYLWSRVQSPDIEILAGGVVVEGGYRLEL